MDRYMRPVGFGTAIAVCLFMMLVLVDRRELRAQVGLCQGLAPAVAEMVEARARVAGELETLTASIRSMLERDPSQWRREELLLVQSVAGQIRRGL